MRAQFNLDFIEDSTTMEGAITRAGEFVYSDGSHFKDYDNLVDLFKNVNVIPVIGSKEKDSHLDINERLIGFTWNFKPNEETKQIFADVEFFEDIKDLSDLEDPNKLPVSIGFEDDSDTEIQKIKKVHHLAVSLNKNERDRCSSAGGLPCTISIKNSANMDESSSSLGRPRKIIKQKKVDSMNLKKKKEITEDTTEEEIEEEEEKEITEDAQATPDNLGTETHKVEQNTKSAKAAWMLDCQKYGPYSESQCSKGWAALNSSPASPMKSGKKDFDEIKEDVAEIKSVISDLAEIIPTLAEVAQDKSQAKAQEMVKMKEDLIALDFCDKWVETIDDFDEMSKFYQGVMGNKALVKEDTAEEIKQANTSRLLGKKKKEQTDFEDMMEIAKKDAMRRLYPVKMFPNGTMVDPLAKRGA